MLQVDVAEIVIEEGDEPDAVVDLLNSKPLPGEHRRDVDPFAVHADWPARSDEHIPIVERVFDGR